MRDPTLGTLGITWFFREAGQVECDVLVLQFASRKINQELGGEANYALDRDSLPSLRIHHWAPITEFKRYGRLDAKMNNAMTIFNAC